MIEIPEQWSCLYRHFDKDGALLYVGIAINPMMRYINDHRRFAHWFKDITRIEIEHFPTRKDAFAAERQAIAAEKPLHNVRRPSTKKMPLRVSPRLLTERAIVERLIRLKACYTPIEAAETLCIPVEEVFFLIDRGELGCIEIVPGAQPSQRGWRDRNRHYGITGWQLLEFFDARHAEAAQARKLRIKISKVKMREAANEQK
ncbi:MAG: GIY-YIG nuclease family protein [Rhodospirillaceae bacterium]|nr:MAG: GIY-YIG nuclease family protein [Rhodospirillaceae bacterium]